MVYKKYMDLADKLAMEVDSRMTWRNPRVGAVIIKNNKILGVGVHREFGKEHAEVNAYNSLVNKNDIIDSTIYVTLEPCAHHGKVGSCAERIVKWKVRKVIIGSIDPNPKVQGKGIEILKEAGIEVEVLNNGHNKKINPKFDYYFNAKLPYVTLKIAQSLDGKVNIKQETNQKITDIISDVDVHNLRAQNDVIMIGSSTALIDNPALSVRFAQNINGRQPLKVILDRRGRLEGSHFEFDANTVIYTNNVGLLKAGSNYKFLNNFQIKGILKNLYEKGIQAILVEGGPELINSFIAEGLWEQLYIYQNTQIFGNNGLRGIKSNISSGVLIDSLKIGTVTRMIINNSERASLCLPE